MSGGNINKELFFSTLKSDLANGTNNSTSMLKRSFLGLSDDNYESIVELVLDAINKQEADKVSLVATTPPSFSISAKTTMTGYSLSSYFADLVDTIVSKSQQGVFVKFFVNDIENQSGFDKILRYRGRFLKVYNYKQEDDKMAALHAKVISVDQEKTLITSANLSYHGQQGNIELGTLIESKDIAKQIDDIFTKLIFSKVFYELD